MRRISKWIAVAVNSACLTAFAIPSAFGQSACTGQSAPGSVCGNSTSATRPVGSLTPLAAVFNQAFCSTANSALVNISGSWVCLASANSSVWITSAGGVPSPSPPPPPAVQANITQLGTIASGTWHGSPIGAAYGGFGSDISASSGVPLFASGTPTFTPTTGTGNFARAISPTFTGSITAAAANFSGSVLVVSPTLGTLLVEGPASGSGNGNQVTGHEGGAFKWALGSYSAFFSGAHDSTPTFVTAANFKIYTATTTYAGTFNTDGSTNLAALYGVADIRLFGTVVCNGSSSTGVDAAISAANGLGYTRFFLPKSCWWNLGTTRSNTVPAGWEIFGEDWTSSVLTVTDVTANTLQAGANALLHNVGVRDLACRGNGTGGGAATKTCPVQNYYNSSGSANGPSNYPFEGLIMNCASDTSPAPDNVSVTDVPCAAFNQASAGDGTYYQTVNTGLNIHIETNWTGSAGIVSNCFGGGACDMGIKVRNGHADSSGALHYGLFVDEFGTNAAVTNGSVVINRNKIVNTANSAISLAMYDTSPGGNPTYTSPWISMTSNYQSGGQFININQGTTAFTGSAFVMNFGQASGTFSGAFIQLLKNSVTVFQVKDDGGLEVTGQLGVTCSGVTAGTVVVTKGIVTHC